MSVGLETVVDLLACPHCRLGLALRDRSVVCDSGHAYDVARQGYVNLLPGGPPASADTAAMVAARERVLDSGVYEPIADALDRAVGRLSGGSAGGVLVDAGAGPGWYLQRLLDRRPAARGLALDVSVPACRRAARRHPRLGAAVADTWRRLPVRDRVADIVTSIFAPRHAAEFARVLAPAGRLVVAAAEPDHLAGLRARFGLLGVEEDKHSRLEAALAADFVIESTERVAFSLTLGPEVVVDLVGMGPNAFHGAVDRPDGPLDATAVVRLTVAALRG